MYKIDNTVNRSPTIGDEVQLIIGCFKKSQLKSKTCMHMNPKLYSGKCTLQ